MENSRKKRSTNSKTFSWNTSASSKKCNSEPEEKEKNGFFKNKFSSKILKDTGITIFEDKVEYSWPPPLILTINNYQSKKIKTLKNATIKSSSRTSDKNDKSIFKILWMNSISSFAIRERLIQILKKESIDMGNNHYRDKCLGFNSFFKF